MSALQEPWRPVVKKLSPEQLKKRLRQAEKVLGRPLPRPVGTSRKG